MSVDDSLPVSKPPSWIFGYVYFQQIRRFVAQPYSGIVTKAHSSTFIGSRDTEANEAWGNFTRPRGGYKRVKIKSIMVTCERNVWQNCTAARGTRVCTEENAMNIYRQGHTSAAVQESTRAEIVKKVSFYNAYPISYTCKPRRRTAYIYSLSIRPDLMYIHSVVD